ncbi:MAG: recombinase family protein [Rhodovulum sp.]|uniref:recombinase family protein n=1 Tax=Rhodoplanes TaxID=29407 RepID=UPI00101C2A76|nr:recombinase family protein [Rhodoplanes serenus]MBI5110448.1 recombinase family protein [Rhodovulum sp.]
MPLVGYVRVSTAQQGRSGLGIEAQRGAMERFAEAEGFELVRVFVEVETGKGSDSAWRAVARNDCAQCARQKVAARINGHACRGSRGPITRRAACSHGSRS